MTFHISNPNQNPKKSRKRHSFSAWEPKRSSWDAFQKNDKKQPDKVSVGFTSSFNSFMTEFNSQKDKTPKNYENWHRSRPIEDITEINEFGEEKYIGTKWTKPATLPRKSVSSGIGKMKNKTAAIAKLQLEIESSYHAKKFNYNTGKWEENPNASKIHRNLDKYPEVCFAKQDGKCTKSECKGTYPEQYSCLHEYDRNTGHFWIAGGAKEKLEAK